MQVVFVRHADAVEAGDFEGTDLDRPLTRKGWRTARKGFRRLAQVMDRPAVIVHSAARRARETAEVLQEVYPDARVLEDPALNPGASAGRIRRVLRAIGVRRGAVAVVGHEPDLSRALEDLTGARCRLGKGGVAVVGEHGGYRLEALLQLDQLRAMKKPRAGRP